MLWRVGEVRNRHWDKGGVGGTRIMSWTVVGCIIFEVEMNWAGALNRIVDDDKFARMIQLVGLNVEKKGEKQLHPKGTYERR